MYIQTYINNTHIYKYMYTYTHTNKYIHKFIHTHIDETLYKINFIKTP